LKGTLNIEQGYVKQASNQTVEIATINITGGSLEVGMAGYITAANFNLLTDNWLSLTEAVGIGQKKGIISIGGSGNIVSGSTVTTISSDGRYETTMWVYEGTWQPPELNATFFSKLYAVITSPSIYADDC
jgi:hypothetical protein